MKRHKTLCSVLVCFLAAPCLGFLPNFWSRVLTLSWDSQTHQFITERAILNVTMETLRAIKQRDGTEELSRLGRGFWRAVGDVVKSNAAMDFLSSTRSDPVYHFDSEQWDGALAALRQMWTQTLLSLKAGENQSARRSLGQLFHSLQDFYSHSNWVELGHGDVYLHLLHPEEPAVPVAKVDTPTCLECFSLTCRDNLLSGLRSAHGDSLLTTGYFSTTSRKPEGKCSHGGMMDSSRSLGARGGINKDSTSPLFSPHHYLHTEAARVATEATLAVLRDLRDTVGPKLFLNLLSVDQAPALVFVLDTTGSMFEEITAARLRAHSIIAQRAQTPQQPATFILVPFHDPEVGPVSETDDPQEFMQHMENLLALGGGDEPEMCLSAVQLALTHSPPLSEIFVFTDASPKDAHLFDAVKALVLEKQSKVTFLLTEDPRYATESRRRRRRGSETLPPDRFALYSSLSSLSGGMTIFTSNSDIHRVSAIVEDNTAADKVTLLHAESDGEQWSTHSFLVDESLKNVTLHVTGLLSECLLTSPAGLSQSLLNDQGPLAGSEHLEGLYRVRLLHPVQPGQWLLQAKSDQHVTFNVIGDSSVDFLYYFATVTNETHPGLARTEGSPIAGAPAFLVLSVTGLAPNAEISFSHVTLLGADGESVQQVALNSSSSPSGASVFSVLELVGRVQAVPREPFSVRLTGRDRSGAKVERVSSEMIQPTHVQIQVSSAPHLVPGHSTMVTFDLLNHGPARFFSLTADDDCGFLQNRGPHRFHVSEQGSFRGQVDLLTSPSARPGATVTLSLSVRDTSSADSNYAVAFLTVVPPDPDTAPPACTVTQLQSSCNTSICSESRWSASLVISDRGRSGLAFIQLHSGEGIVTLHHRPPQTLETPRMHRNHRRNHHRTKLQTGDAPFNVSDLVPGPSQPLWVGYTSSCCSRRAELLLWDGAGNMKRCRVASGQQRAHRDDSAEISGAKRTDTSFVLITWGLLCVFLVK